MAVGILLQYEASPSSLPYMLTVTTLVLEARHLDGSDICSFHSLEVSVQAMDQGLL